MPVSRAPDNEFRVEVGRVGGRLGDARETGRVELRSPQCSTGRLEVSASNEVLARSLIEQGVPTTVAQAWREYQDALPTEEALLGRFGSGYWGHDGA
jgi:hypothetical protein